MVGVKITKVGSSSLADVGKRLRQAGDRELRRELLRGIREGTKPLIKDAKSNALRTLPTRGGLGARVARTRIDTRTRTGSRTAGVRLTAATNAVRDPKRIDRGRIRHPVYGHRPWVFQNVQPGWFSDAMRNGAPKVRKELLNAIHRISVKIGRR